jgi:coproporphyrinogen III oxidase
VSSALENRQNDARAWFEALQQRIIASLEAIEREAPGPFHDANARPGRFVRKSWDRTDQSGAPGGGGIMATLAGRVFEKGGVHVSTVFGTFAPEFAAQIPGADSDPRFWASGISLIVHPWSPHVPTVHMNTRFVCTSKAWFGGGADLTPMLNARRTQDDPDAIAFHAAMRGACERHAGVADYRRYKEWCDEYFFLKHRNEPRGIGGTFFDDFSEGGFDGAFAVMRAVGDAFIPAYLPIAKRRLDKPYGDRERDFQAYRRGRYVEFNLVWDRGTLFGLQSGGRAESILMSLPPVVRWRYDWTPQPGSPEAKLQSVLMPPRDWANA